MADRAFTWYDIPAGAKPQPCKGSTCEEEIYFVKSTKSVAHVPVSVTPEGAYHPTATEPGRGVSHYQNCVDVDEFQRKRPSK